MKTSLADCLASWSHRLDRQPTVGFVDGAHTMLQNIDPRRDAPVWDEKSTVDATRD